MKTQKMYYEKAQGWLDAERLPTEAELAELEGSYQDWIKETLTSNPLAWDWETESDEDLYTDLDCDWETESDEDLYTDLDPDWDEYSETGRLY